MIDIPIMLTDELRTILEEQGTKAEDYKPAYGGESIGLDLYATQDVTIKNYLTANMKAEHEFEKGLKEGKDLMPLIEKCNEGIKKVLIPTGVHMALPKGYVCFVKDRGSISKTELTRRAGVIDPGYTGEIFVNLASIGGLSYIKKGDKLPVQLVVVKAETNYTVVSKEQFLELTTDAQRGEGKTGSSD